MSEQVMEVPQIEDQGAYEHWRKTGEVPNAPQPEAEPEKKAEEGGDQQAEAAEDAADGEADATEGTEEGTEGGKEGEEGTEHKRLTGSAKKKLQLEAERAEKAQLAAEKARLEAELRSLREKYEPKPQGPPVKPNVADYDTLEAYDQAVEEWGDKKAAWEYEQRVRQERMKERIKVQQEQARLKYADYDAKISAGADLPMSPVMATYMAEESEHFGELAYWLASHPDKASEIAGMPPIKAVRELARIERDFDAPSSGSERKAPASTKPAAQISKAPPPINPVSTSGSPQADYGDRPWEKLPEDEQQRAYERMRAQRRA